jgi:hypothetical protein
MLCLCVSSLLWSLLSLFVQSSLFNTLVVSGLCSLTVVPAAIGISGTALPEAAQAVAAFGQLMLVALWTATLMGPRIMQLRKEHQQLAGRVAQTVVQLQRISSAVKPVQPGALNIGEQIGMTLPDYVERFQPLSSALGPDHSAKPLSHSAAKAELIQGDPNVLSANPMSGAASPQLLSASDARYHMPGLASQPNSSVAATHGSDPISILPFLTPATTPESDVLTAQQQRALQPRVPLPPIIRVAARPLGESSSFSVLVAGSTNEDDASSTTNFLSAERRDQHQPPSDRSSSSSSSAQWPAHPTPTPAAANLLTHAAIASAVHASEMHLALQRRSLFEPLERALTRCAAEWHSSLMPLTSRPSWNDRASSSSPRNAGHSSTSSIVELELPSPSDVGSTGIGDTSPQYPVGHHHQQHPHHHRERSSSLLPSEKQRILVAAAVYLRAVDEAVQAALEGNDNANSPPGASSNSRLLLLSTSGLIHVLSSHHWSAVPGEGFTPLATQLSAMAAAELPRGLQSPSTIVLRSSFDVISSPEHTVDTAFMHSLRNFVAQLQSALASCVSRALQPVSTAAASSVPAAAVASSQQQLQSRSPLPPLQFPAAVIRGASSLSPASSSSSSLPPRAAAAVVVHMESDSESDADIEPERTEDEQRE